MKQIDRDKQAIRQVLRQKFEPTFDDIQLAAGEGLAPVLSAMVKSGEVIRIEGLVRPTYRLKQEA